MLLCLPPGHFCIWNIWSFCVQVFEASPTLKQKNPSFLLQFFFGICVLSHFSQSDSATHWTVACQAPLSMEFSRWEYWSGLPFFPPRDLPDPGLESTALQSDSLPAGPPGKPWLSEVSVNVKNISFSWFYVFIKYQFQSCEIPNLGIKMVQCQQRWFDLNRIVK